MKYLSNIATTIFCLVALMTLKPSFAETQQAIEIHTPKPQLKLVVIEFCPMFCYKDRSSPSLGKILKELYAEQGIEVVLFSLPMARAFKEVLEGQYDGIINPDHPALASLQRNEKSIYDMKICMYSHSGSTWNQESDPNMTSLRLGLVKDYNYKNYSSHLATIVNLATRENRAEFIVPFSQPDARNFRKLLAGRIDVTITSHAVAKYLIELNQWQGRIKKNNCFNNYLPTYIWFSPKRPNIDYYQKILDNNIERYKQQDYYKRFIKTYRDS